MSAHTPGPWRLVGRIESSGEVERVVSFHPDNLHYSVADVIDANGYPENQSNMHLICAAPDLLEALIMIRDADEDCKRDGLPTIPAVARAKIDAAIAKAEGKP